MKTASRVVHRTATEPTTTIAVIGPACRRMDGGPGGPSDPKVELVGAVGDEGVTIGRGSTDGCIAPEEREGAVDILGAAGAICEGESAVGVGRAGCSGRDGSDVSTGAMGEAGIEDGDEGSEGVDGSAG